MKKKTLAFLLTTALCLSLTLSSCSSKKEVCSVDGCSQEVYKDGLCADHYVDAAAENSYGGTIRSSFTFQEMTKTNHISLYECKQDWQTEFFDYVKSVCTGQHTSELEEQLAENYYHYVFVSKNTGKTVDDGYYLLVPEAWYTNS